VLVVHRNGTTAAALTISRDAGGRVVVIANPAIDRARLAAMAGLALELAERAELGPALPPCPACIPAAGEHYCLLPPAGAG
jgi:hypothetical protein